MFGYEQDRPGGRSLQRNGLPHHLSALVRNDSIWLDLQPFFFMELIHFLGGETEFGYRYGTVLGEAEIVDFVVTDANTVGNLVPVVIGVQAVTALRLLGIIQFAVAAS